MSGKIIINLCTRSRACEHFDEARSSCLKEETLDSKAVKLARAYKHSNSSTSIIHYQSLCAAAYMALMNMRGREKEFSKRKRY